MNNDTSSYRGNRSGEAIARQSAGLANLLTYSESTYQNAPVLALRRALRHETWHGARVVKAVAKGKKDPNAQASVLVTETES